MNDDKIKQTFKQMDIPAVDSAAKKRAINAALSEFKQAQQEQASEKNQQSHQGFWNWLRPISNFYNESRKAIMNILNNKLLYPGFATLFVAVMGALLFQQLYQEPDVFHNQPADITNVSNSDNDAIKVEAGLKQQKNVQSEEAIRLEKPSPALAEQKPAVEEQEIVVTGIRQSLKKALSTKHDASSVVDAINAEDIGKFPDHFVAESMQRIQGTAVPTTQAVGAGKLSIRQNDTLPNTGYQEKGRDRFESIEINRIKRVTEEPVSTFSIDVDTASYSFVRRQLNQGVLPQKDAVRVEEMLNYFDYQYPLPTSKRQPFKPTVVVHPSPWNKNTQLIHIGIKGYDIPVAKQPRSNIVLLLDVSGSMNSPDKLPLVKQSMGMLMNSLKPNDTIGIVVYAGAAGKVLEPTKVKDKQKILDALNRLQAGGSTAGAQGIQLAYQLAEANFDKNAVNRIILATDGDFNVGINNRDELKGFVERKREKGIFLSVLGFGQGNYHDHLMQTLAQNGNGVAAYIDSLSEAQKVLIDEATSTLFPIAKDVKIQVEFNPNTVEEYRLIGYETRHLNREDFNNDKVDAGDIGAGHTVTAIYEITPRGGRSSVDDLRYGNQTQADENKKTFTNEYGYLKVRYKLPKEKQSKLITQAIEATDNNQVLQTEVNFATAVAGFAQLLKGGQYMNQYGYDDVIKQAQSNKSDDKFGYRTEFIQLVRKTKIANPM